MDEEVRKILQDYEQRISTVESEIGYSKLEDLKRDKQYTDMMTILIQIKGRIDHQDGAKEGARSMVKVFWAVFGSLIVAAILGVSGLLWSLNAKIAVIDNIVKGG